jgi:hypothetical protein
LRADARRRPYPYHRFSWGKQLADEFEEILRSEPSHRSGPLSSTFEQSSASGDLLGTRTASAVVPPQAIRPRARIARKLRRGGVAVLIVLAMSGLTWVVGWNVLWERRTEAACSRFEPGLCIDLSAEYVARVSGVALPSGSVVTSSDLAPGFLHWSMDATVRLPAGSMLTERYPVVKKHVNASGQVIIVIHDDGDGTHGPAPK